VLKQAYHYGVKIALARFKIAIPLPDATSYGSAPNPSPSGPEQSHGTLLNTYPSRSDGNPPTTDPSYNFESKAHGKDRDADYLWNISEYDRLAPVAAGEWGQEVIG
jgi:hypothetical protein